MIWLYIDTKDVAKVSALASSVFWLVIPSLALFVTLPVLLKQGMNFYLSMSISILVTIVCYWLIVTVLADTARVFGLAMCRCWGSRIPLAIRFRKFGLKLRQRFAPIGQNQSCSVAGVCRSWRVCFQTNSVYRFSRA